MKKVLCLLVAGSVIGGVVKAADSLILSVDREELFVGSMAGKAFLKEQEGKKGAAEKQLRDLEQELRASAQRLEKQAPMLTSDALGEKQRNLAKGKRDLERKFEDMQQELKLTFQAGYEKIMTEHSLVAKRVFKAEGGKILVDEKTPGIIAVDKATTSITKKVMAEANKEFEKSLLFKKKEVKKNAA